MGNTFGIFKRSQDITEVLLGVQIEIKSPRKKAEEKNRKEIATDKNTEGSVYI